MHAWCWNNLNSGCFIMNTDQGGDQQGMHTSMARDTENQLGIFYLRQWCVLHQLALIVKTQLERMQKHFGNVAKFCHVWRSPNMAVKIRQSWEKHFKDSAVQTCRRLPPKPLKGRWGAITASEEHIVKCGPSETRVVFADVVEMPAPKTKPKAKAKAKSNVPPLPDQDASAIALKVEEENWLAVYDGDNDQYKKKQGRWITQTIDNVKGDSFWVQCAIVLASRRPVSHFMHYVQSGGAWPGKMKHIVLHKVSRQT